VRDKESGERQPGDSGSGLYAMALVTPLIGGILIGAAGKRPAAVQRQAGRHPATSLATCCRPGVAAHGGGRPSPPACWREVCCCCSPIRIRSGHRHDRCPCLQSRDYWWGSGHASATGAPAGTECAAWRGARRARSPPTVTFMATGVLTVYVFEHLVRAALPMSLVSAFVFGAVFGVGRVSPG